MSRRKNCCDLQSPVLKTEAVIVHETFVAMFQIFIFTVPTWPIGHVGGRLLLRYYDLYQRQQLQFYVLLMLVRWTPETCRVILQ